jgi:hypothetical protein
MSNGIEIVCEMASKDSDWPVSFPPTNWNGIRTTEVVTSVLNLTLILTASKQSPKPRLVTEWSHLYPHPLHSMVGRGGEGSAFSAALKICLIKRDFRLHYHQKQIENGIFITNPRNKKVKIFCDTFYFMLNNIFCLSHPVNK